MAESHGESIFVDDFVLGATLVEGTQRGISGEYLSERLRGAMARFICAALICGSRLVKIITMPDEELEPTCINHPTHSLSLLGEE